MLRLGFICFLSGLWFLLSGHTEWYILSLGAISVILVFALSNRMGIIDREGFPVHLLRRALSYHAWLVARIVESNLEVARLIVRPRLEIAPSQVAIQSTARTDLGRTCLANAITLTPGTVTLGVEGDEVLVHALTREAAEDIQGGEMDRRATWLEASA